MNIEYTIMGKPVLISKLQDRCYSITMYRCRALEAFTAKTHHINLCNYHFSSSDISCILSCITLFFTWLSIKQKVEIWADIPSLSGTKVLTPIICHSSSWHRSKTLVLLIMIKDTHPAHHDQRHLSCSSWSKTLVLLIMLTGLAWHYVYNLWMAISREQCE